VPCVVTRGRSLSEKSEVRNRAAQKSPRTDDLTLVRAKKAPRNRSFPAFSDTLLATTAQAGGGVIAQMREKLKTAAGQAVYQWRKAIVEPVFGQIKEERRFRRFAFGGLTNVSAEGHSFA